MAVDGTALALAGVGAIALAGGLRGSRVRRADVDPLLRRELQTTIRRMKQEIVRDVATQVVSSQGLPIPYDLQSFAQLHDYVDANCYGGFCDEAQIAYWADLDPRLAEIDGLVEHIANPAQAAVDAWIKAGGLRAAWAGVMPRLGRGPKRTPFTEADWTAWLIEPDTTRRPEVFRLRQEEAQHLPHHLVHLPLAWRQLLMGLVSLPAKGRRSLIDIVLTLEAQRFTVFDDTQRILESESSLPAVLARFRGFHPTLRVAPQFWRPHFSPRRPRSLDRTRRSVRGVLLWPAFEDDEYLLVLEPWMEDCLATAPARCRPRRGAALSEVAKCFLDEARRRHARQPLGRLVLDLWLPGTDISGCGYLAVEAMLWRKKA